MSEENFFWIFFLLFFSFLIFKVVSIIYNYWRYLTVGKKYYHSQSRDDISDTEREARKLLEFLRNSLTKEEQITLYDLNIKENGKPPFKIHKIYELTHGVIKSRMSTLGVKLTEENLAKYYYEYLYNPNQYPFENKAIKFTYQKLTNIAKYKHTVDYDPLFVIVVALSGLLKEVEEHKKEVIENIRSEYNKELSLRPKQILDPYLVRYPYLAEEIERLVSTRFTKYGNHYENIYNRYEKNNQILILKQIYI